MTSLFDNFYETSMLQIEVLLKPKQYQYIQIFTNNMVQDLVTFVLDDILAVLVINITFYLFSLCDKLAEC